MSTLEQSAKVLCVWIEQGMQIGFDWKLAYLILLCTQIEIDTSDKSWCLWSFNIGSKRLQQLIETVYHLKVPEVILDLIADMTQIEVRERSEKAQDMILPYYCNQSRQCHWNVIGLYRPQWNCTVFFDDILEIQITVTLVPTAKVLCSCIIYEPQNALLIGSQCKITVAYNQKYSVDCNLFHAQNDITMDIVIPSHECGIDLSIQIHSVSYVQYFDPWIEFATQYRK